MSWLRVLERGKRYGETEVYEAPDLNLHAGEVADGAGRIMGLNLFPAFVAAATGDARAAGPWLRSADPFHHSPGARQLFRGASQLRDSDQMLIKLRWRL